MTDLRRLWHTVRHLRPVQISNRIVRRLLPPRLDTRPGPPLRAPVAPLIPGPPRAAEWLDDQRVRVLHHEGRIVDAAGWQDPQADRLWLYHCHYHDDLRAQAAAGRQRALIARWIAENPPGRGCGWEPYPVALRVVNWLAWHGAGHVLDAAWAQHLAMQVRWLRGSLEWHLLANHLWADAKAVFAAGLWFTGPEAERWRQQGAALAEAQIAEQVLADGGHIERSPMYHAQILHDLLDLLAFHRAVGETPPAWIATRARAMGSWLAAMSHPDGDIVQFNDAALDHVATHGALAAYGERLGVSWSGPAAVQHLDPSGYVRAARGDAVLFADGAPVGPDWQPGHAHADTLTFELSLAGHRLVVDPGTSCYGTGAERLRQRGTPAHNTLSVDGGDSSEVWSGFRVARRARPGPLTVETSDAQVVITGSHDGWCRLGDVGRHERRWTLDGRSLRIEDQVAGSGSRELSVSLLLAPETAAVQRSDGAMELQHHGKTVTVEFPAGWQTAIVADLWGRGFNDAVPTRRLRATRVTPLPARATTILRW